MSASSTPLLEIDDLEVTFPGRRAGWFGARSPIRAVDGVSFDIQPGEIVGLVGESGSGKSTIGRTVLGLQAPTAGSVRFDGQQLGPLGRGRDRALASSIQAVFQDPLSSLNPTMRIGGIVGEPLRWLRGMKDRTERDAEVCRLLEAVGIDPTLRHRSPFQLSGGQRQRVAIARALAPNPRLIVCDEAVSALDVSTQAQIINLLNDLRRSEGIAYLFIAHDLDVVHQISDRVGVLYRGQLAEWGDGAQVHEAPRHPYTAALLAAVPGQPGRRRSSYSAPDASVAAPPGGGCPFAPRCRFAFDACAERPPDLPFGDAGLVACHLHGPDRPGAGRPLSELDEPPDLADVAP